MLWTAFSTAFNGLSAQKHLCATWKIREIKKLDCVKEILLYYFYLATTTALEFRVKQRILAIASD
jgi:hypothetical protein